MQIELYGLSWRHSFLTPLFKAGTATVALASLTGSTVYGQPVTLVATVAAAGTPTGTVTFLDGGTALATVALVGSGTAALTASAPGLGAHSITAIYSGDTDFVASGLTAPKLSKKGLL